MITNNVSATLPLLVIFWGMLQSHSKSHNKTDIDLFIHQVITMPSKPVSQLPIYFAFEKLI